jgi:hypothetical protein
MRSLKRKIEITDMYLGVNVGYWFLRENRIYVAGAFSPLRRLLFGSLILLDESHGQVLREWFWNYSHCLEFVLSNPAALTKEYSYNGLPLGEWFGKQMRLMESGSFNDSQENAMKELLTLIGTKEPKNNPSA